MEAKLWDGEEFPFTTEWYKTRERAPHLEQPWHRPRLERAAELITGVLNRGEAKTVVDFGCGDGGLLTLLPPSADAWGYDLMPENVQGAVEGRKVRVELADFLNPENDEIRWGDVAVATEVLEHLEDPHAFVRRIANHSKFLVASSPYTETVQDHDGLHAWCWDLQGYAAMIQAAGFKRMHHSKVDRYQVVLAVRV